MTFNPPQPSTPSLSTSSSSPRSDGESPSNHRHLLSADVGGGSHDVPQPPHGDVRLHAGTDRRRAGSAQRLLAGHPDHAGPGSRWSRLLLGELGALLMGRIDFCFFSPIVWPPVGAVPQVYLTTPPGTVQIPVSAVQLHPVRQDLHFTSETLIFSKRACAPL